MFFDVERGITLKPVRLRAIVSLEYAPGQVRPHALVCVVGLDGEVAEVYATRTQGDLRLVAGMVELQLDSVPAAQFMRQAERLGRHLPPGPPDIIEVGRPDSAARERAEIAKIVDLAAHRARKNKSRS